MDRAELEAHIWRVFGMHLRGGLSEPALVAALVDLASEYAAGDGPEVTAARRKVLASTDGGQ